MSHTKPKKNKISGSDIYSDSDEDSFVILPAAFTTAKIYPSTIVTRSSGKREDVTSTSSTKVAHVKNTVHDSNLEMITHSAIKSHELFKSNANNSTKPTNYSVGLLGTIVAKNYHQKIPYFRKKP